MRYLSIAIIAVLASAAPALAQERDSGDVSVKAKEAPIDQTPAQRAMPAKPAGISVIPSSGPAGSGPAADQTTVGGRAQ